MVSVFAALGFTDLCLAFAALELFTFLDPQCGAGRDSTTSADEAALLHSSAEALLLMAAAAVGVLFVVVALTFHHLTARQVVADPVADGAGNGRRSISGLLMFALCVSAGTLEFMLFGQAGGGAADAEDHGAHARALGLAALRALPAAATATFFLGMVLIIVAHVRAGGEGGGTGAVAGDGLIVVVAHVPAGGEGGGAGRGVSADEPIQGHLGLLTKIAAGAAAALVGVMAMAVTLYGGVKYWKNGIEP